MIEHHNKDTVTDIYIGQEILFVEKKVTYLPINPSTVKTRIFVVTLFCGKPMITLIEESDSLKNPVFLPLI